MTPIQSIDALRGLVMLLMLVDHAREFFFLHAQVSDPMDVNEVTPALYLSRLAAHLCAPVFVALTGLSAWLYGAQRSRADVSAFLFKRGLFLVVLELTLVSFAWTFALPPEKLYLQVIWVIGLSMIALAALVHLPRAVLVALGLAIVLGHNLVDPITVAPDEFGYIAWTILHEWACCLRFDDEEIEKERGVVLEEWRRRLGPGQRYWDRLAPDLYRGAPHAERMPIGLVDVIRRCPAATIRAFYKRWYRPENMAVVVVGDAGGIEGAVEGGGVRVQPVDVRVGARGDAGVHARRVGVGSCRQEGSGGAGRRLVRRGVRRRGRVRTLAPAPARVRASRRLGAIRRF